MGAGRTESLGTSLETAILTAWWAASPRRAVGLRCGGINFLAGFIKGYWVRSD